MDIFVYVTSLNNTFYWCEQIMCAAIVSDPKYGMGRP